MKSLHIKAYGKLNLFLHILRKRPDGYHDLFSVFHKVALHDDLIFRRIPENQCRIVTAEKRLPKDGSNLIVKAFELLRKEMDFSGGIEVKVKKRIPMGGGMGGGSSDAAATLKAVNQIFRLNLSPRKLHLLGLRLGADVPFFLAPCKSAVVTGIGEKIRPFSKINSFYFLLIFFPKELSTRLVYEALGYDQLNKLTLQKTSVRISAAPINLTTLEKLKQHCRNDLMRPSFDLYPLTQKIYQFISSQGYAVSQTGSGPTLFVAHKTKSRLLTLERNIKRLFNLKTQITQSL